MRCLVRKLGHIGPRRAQEENGVSMFSVNVNISCIISENVWHVEALEERSERLESILQISPDFALCRA